ncbi:MAG TPA: MFS transporter [Ramlibacter sp.]|nr:MFS transporter [Ramlibacter sp.]
MSHIGKSPCDEGAVLYGAETSPRPRAAQRWTLVAAVLGSSMAFLDGTVVNVALPAIQRDLQATASQAQWVIESYSLFLAALLLVGGSLGDRFGRRRIFVTGVALFTIAAAGCAFAVSAGQLIAARAVQGIGAALLVPGSLALISATFPQSQRGQAIGTWSAFSGIAAAVGPVLGGFLVDHYSWTWAFLINLPIGAILIALCVVKVPENRATQAQQPGLDFWGASFATIGLAGVVFAFIEAPNLGWTAAPVASAGLGGVLALALFVVVEARSRSPMLPLSLLRIRNFAGANLLTLLLYAALGGGLYFFPLNLIQVQGYSAAAAGAALLPFIVIMFLLSRWAGKLVDRFGPRLPLVAGPLIAAAGFALFTLPAIGGPYWSTFLPAVSILGLGMAVTVAPLTTTVMNSVGSELAGLASGVNNAVSRAGALLSIAVFGVVMSGAFNPALERGISALDLPPALQRGIEEQRQRLAAITVPPQVDAKTAESIKLAVGEAFIAGFRRVMLVCAALALLSALSAAAWIRSESRSPAQRRPVKP